MSLSDKIQIIPRNLIKDQRGWFLKVINGEEDNLPKYTGEIYFTNALPGQSRGGHYHIRAKEWFTLINGECNLFLVDVETSEKMVLNLSSDDPITVFVPSKIAHSFVNIGDGEFLLMAYNDLLYDPTDTIPFEFKY